MLTRNGLLLMLALAASPALAAPCTAEVPGAPRISLQRDASGTFHLHYEAAVLAYVPQFESPAVSVAGKSISITKMVSDNPPPALPLPSVPSCDADDVDLPAL